MNSLSETENKRLLLTIFLEVWEISGKTEIKTSMTFPWRRHDRMVLKVLTGITKGE